ncbi:MAG TPA: hypothetical protein VMG12_29025, partial [Polyangiaceae bacterium]|nr:hypothetical protein [Polyangiaceae bacterium]
MLTRATISYCDGAKRSASRGRPARVVVAGIGALAAWLAAERDAGACSYGVPYQPGTVRCDVELAADGLHTSIADARFGVADIDVERPPPLPDSNAVGCSPLQVLGLQFQWGDDATWPSDVGLLVTLEDGDFPWQEPRLSETEHGLGGVLRADDSGQVQFFGLGDPYEPLDVTLAVRAIDCAGASSEPITVRISDPGSARPDADGSNDIDAVGVADAGGCSLNRTPVTLANATAPLLIALCAGLMGARRARRRAPRARASRVSVALGAGVLVLAAAEREASACSLAGEPILVSACVTEPPPHTSAADAVLELEQLLVRRSAHAPPGGGDCGELGHLDLGFRWGDSDEWPSDIRILLTVEDGEVPWTLFLPPLTTTEFGPSWVKLTETGRLSFVGQDDPSQPLDITLSARALDCSGAASSPIEIRITDPGREPPPDDL